MPDPSLVERIDALLPQTQCTKCGYDGCRPYAQAIARGEAPINRCPPGGDAGIAALARLLGQDPLPLDESRGKHGPLAVAVIDERHCIGCTLCIAACPVDAIAGANKRMHTVIPDLCTGCELCLPPCPVDCIAMRPVEPPRAWTADDAARARQRHAFRKRRLQRERERAEARLAARSAAARAAQESAQPADAAGGAPAADPKQAAIARALARARARRAQEQR